MYKLTESAIFKSDEKLSIPRDPDNRHYQQFLQDVIDGAIVEGEDVVEPNYAELRASEYPAISEQLDMQYHDDSNGTTTWKDAIDAIKVKYPKTIVGGTTVADVPAWVQAAADEKQFNQQLAAYRTATARLAQYVLADGREEVTEMQPTGEQVFNEETGEMEDVMHEVIVQTAIEPLEPTVTRMVYSDDMDAEPTEETIENPLITTDVAERGEAQATVDATPAAVVEAA